MGALIENVSSRLFQKIRTHVNYKQTEAEQVRNKLDIFWNLMGIAGLDALLLYFATRLVAVVFGYGLRTSSDGTDWLVELLDYLGVDLCLCLALRCVDAMHATC